MFCYLYDLFLKSLGLDVKSLGVVSCCNEDILSLWYQPIPDFMVSSSTLQVFTNPNMTHQHKNLKVMSFPGKRAVMVANEKTLIENDSGLSDAQGKDVNIVTNLLIIQDLIFFLSYFVPPKKKRKRIAFLKKYFVIVSFVFFILTVGWLGWNEQGPHINNTQF